MHRKWWYKLVFLLFLVGFSAYQIYPTIAFKQGEVPKDFPVQEQISLGLDLQGGLYMIMGIEFPEVYNDSLKRNFLTFQKQANEDGFAISNWSVDKGSDEFNPTLSFTLDEKIKAEDLRKKIKGDYGYTFKILLQEDNSDGTAFQLGFTSDFLLSIRDRTVKQSIEVLRNRIDELGVKEPVIASHGSDKILVELPGIKDITRAKELIGQTAKLEFKIVSQEMPAAELATAIDTAEKNNVALFPEGQSLSARVRALNKLLTGKLPEGTEVAFERITDPVTGAVTGTRPYLLVSQVDVTGEDLQDAFVSTDQQTNRPEIAMTFNFRGAEKFERVTGANVGKLLAIVLDGVVKSAPVLEEKIGGGRARIRLGQGNYQDILKEARDVAIVLRAGALPAQLIFQEQRVVGPSLGADSIEAGKKASMIACMLVLCFMLFYYRKSGIIADIALLVNALFVFAILVGLEATLTLPGIAGIALTLGIAVDANVIIFERIREELRAGKTPIAAVEQGFARALSTILDANITTAVACIVLMEFGAGPIRGFAVTLLVGIITTVFTAIFASRLLFDWWTLRPGKDPSKFSI